ncbi:MAG: Spy/CpxP family protein refolding chaperone [Xanthobacteraceae bacterium]
MVSRMIMGALLATCLVLPFESSRVLAQTAANTTTASTDVEAHITTLRGELVITQAEIPQWNAFADVMRENAAAMETLYRQRSQSTGTMNAAQILESYRDFAKMHLADLDRLVPAFAKLYAVLSPEQQKTADALFASRPAHRDRGAQ